MMDSELYDIIADPAADPGLKVIAMEMICERQQLRARARREVIAGERRREQGLPSYTPPR